MYHKAETEDTDYAKARKPQWHITEIMSTPQKCTWLHYDLDL